MKINVILIVCALRTNRKAFEKQEEKPEIRRMKIIQTIALFS